MPAGLETIVFRGSARKMLLSDEVGSTIVAVLFGKFQYNSIGSL